MPIRTDHYLLDAFLEGDVYSALMDSHRFSTVDNQLNSIGKIIGDGRIDGWQIQTDVYPYVRVTAGSGIINRFYVNTFSDQLIELADNGTFYFYAQRRVGIVGDSGPKSNVVSVSYSDSTPPATPTLSLSSSDGFRVDLSWTGNSEDDFSHYEVHRSNDGVYYELIASLPQSTLNYQDSTVNELTTYWYRLRAYDLSGNYSQDIQTITTDESNQVPTEASEVEVIPSERAINVLWKPASFLGSRVLKHYFLTCQHLYHNDVPVSGDIQNIVTTNLYARFDNLANGEKYKITVQVVDNKDKISDGISHTVMTVFRPNAPPDPTSITYSDEPGLPQSVILNLDWIEGDSPYDPLTSAGYRIYVTVDKKTESLPISVAGGFTNERISIIPFGAFWSTIPEDTLVTIRITALAAGGSNASESFGNYVRFRTNRYSVPSAVQGLGATFDPFTGLINVVWNVRPDTQTIRFKIEDKVIGSPLPFTTIFDEDIGQADRYIFRDAIVNHSYRFTVYACTLTGSQSDPSTVITNLSKDDINSTFSRPPLVPITLVAGDRQITIKWANNLDYIQSYKLYRRKGNISYRAGDWSLVDDTIPTTMEEFTDYGLDNDSRYSYYMTSVDVYGRETPHLPDGEYNLNFVTGIPKTQTLLREPYGVNIAPYVPGMGINISWYGTIIEPFDSFTLYRSINNLHSWQAIANIPRGTNEGPYSYIDNDMPLVNGTTYYYCVEKVLNDADIKVFTTTDKPDASICLGIVVTGTNEILSIDTSCVRDIKNLEAPLKELVNREILSHKHAELTGFNPTRIDLNANLIVTDWTTDDGKIWNTKENISGGKTYIVKVNGRFPSVFFRINVESKQIVFTQPIVAVDQDGNVTGTLPKVEMWISGVEEVQGTLDSFRINEIHARRIGYGNVNIEQIPTIGHDGRMFEDVMPDKYLLERYNNHTFVLPENTTNPAKNFGTGTTYYSVYTGDGAIETIVNFEGEDDDSVVAFNKPSYSNATQHHLKQESFNNGCSYGDIFSHVLFKDNIIWGVAGSTLYSVDVTDPSKDHTMMTFTEEVVDLAFDVIHSEMLCLLGNYAPHSIGVIDLATKKVTVKYTLTPSHELQNIAIMPYGSTSYIFALGKNGQLYKYDYETGTLQEGYPVGYLDTNHRGLAYLIQPTPMMFSTHNGFGLQEVNPIDGSRTTLFSGVQAMDIAVDHKYPLENSGNIALYGVTSSGDLYCFLKSNLGWGSINFRTNAPFRRIEMPTAFEAFQINPISLPLGNYPEFEADAYIRSEITISESATVASASLNLVANSLETSNGDATVVISLVDPAISNTVDIQPESVSTISESNTIGGRILSLSSWTAGQAVDIDVTDLVNLSRDADKGSYAIFKIHTPGYCDYDAYRNADGTNISLSINYILDYAGVNSDPGGFQSAKSYHLQFQFADNTPYRWVRITSENTPIKPNPLIKLDKRIRFKILLTKGSFYLALGIREVTSSGNIGDNGDIIGPIEWVGVESTLNYNDTEVVPKGVLINASPSWQEVDFNLRNIKTVAYIGGDGQLSTGYGVIEHLAITINPDDPNSSDRLSFYIDKMEQVDDLMIAGTSQGIQVSYDLGGSWNLVRLTNTPVHKFYASKNNLVWAVTSNEVFLCVDPLYWFPTSGLTGVQSIRDIVEDNDGNMYVSTDKGIYWFEIALLRRYPIWKQTTPINAFSIDTYALYHDKASDEVWVSTEMGIFKTSDHGATWTDTGMGTGGYPAYKIYDINNNPSYPNLIAVNKNSILRKLTSDLDFQSIANLQSENVKQIWTFEYFNKYLYISADNGIYKNVTDNLSIPNAEVTFAKTLSDLNFNGKFGTVFCFNTLDIAERGTLLFIGQENRLSSFSSAGRLSTVTERSGNLPVFFLNNKPISIGYTYNTFNNVLVFREAMRATDVLYASYLPINKYYAENGGWAHTNPMAEFFVYKDHVPKWIYFAFDNTRTLQNLIFTEEKINALTPLTDYNSLQPNATNLKTQVLSTISTLKTLLSPPTTDTTATLSETELKTQINSNIILLMEQLSLFMSSVSSSAISAVGLTLPGIIFIGQESAISGTRAATLAEKVGYTFDSCVGITVNVTTGLFDFSSNPDKFFFTKYDDYSITIFNALVGNVGEYTHKQLEDRMEDRNTGLSSGLASVYYNNMIKTGITLENKSHGLFSSDDLSNIQSKFYASYTDSWYDKLNSTIDYNSIVATAQEPSIRFVNDIYIFSSEPYFRRIWFAADYGIVQMLLDETSLKITLDDVLLPDIKYPFIRDLYATSDEEIYAVISDSTGESKIVRTIDYGITWETINTTNLPNRIFSFNIISGTAVVGTETGIYYSDDNFLGWFRPDFTTSGDLTIDKTNFEEKPVFNVDQSVFLIGEANKMFFRSSQGVAYYSPGYILDVNSINKITRFRTFTYVATDRGLYNDGNSVLSDAIAFSRETLEQSLSNEIAINDIAAGTNAIYVAGANGKIYRYAIHPDYGDFDEWLFFQVPDFTPIHKIALLESSKHLLIATSYDRVKVIDVTPSGNPDDAGEGIFRKSKV